MNKEKGQMNSHTSRTGSVRNRGMLATLWASAALLGFFVGAPPAGATPGDFGFEWVDASVSSQEAGRHPEFVTRFVLNGNATFVSQGLKAPKEALRNVAIELPPGLLGNPEAFPKCTNVVFAAVLSAIDAVQCPVDSQIGVFGPGIHAASPPGSFDEPVFNMESPGGDVVARLGLPIGTFSAVIDISLDPARDNALTATVVSPTHLLAKATGVFTTIWGVPTESRYDALRMNAIEGWLCGAPCINGPQPSGLDDVAFMSNPTSCGPKEVGFSADGYQSIGLPDIAFASVGDITDCGPVPFEPELSLKPTTSSAATAGGVDFSLRIPQDGLLRGTGTASAHLKKAVITMPDGISLNASAADGLGSCTQEEIGVDRDEWKVASIGNHGAPVILTFDGQSTPELPQLASAAQVQAALEALPGIAPGDVLVRGRDGGPWTIRFSGSFAGQDVPELTVSPSELQELGVNAQGDAGTFTLTFDGETTAPLPWNADAATVQAALEALAGIDPGDVEVIGGPASFETIRIAFTGSLSQTDVPAIVGDPSGLVGRRHANVYERADGGAAVEAKTVKEGGALRFDGEEPDCPDSSKVGFGEIVTPVLRDPLRAELFLADQNDNPFDSLLSGYLVASGQGVLIKFAGKFDIDPQTGRLTATFDNNPQQPFSEMELHFKSGNRGVITTPSQCGTYDVGYELTPWSGNAPTVGTSQFTIDQNCDAAGQFAPGFRAGSANPLAGAFSTFVMQVTRNSGQPQLTGVSVDPPLGLTGSLAGIPYCPDAALNAVSGALGTGNAEIASPSCPAASQVGIVVAGAGSGSPFYVDTGKVYLAGPYKGAPFSMGIVTPAVAGPFDLGNVMVRTAVNVDPRTAQIHAVSDPLPTILSGIPLDLRDVRVNLDRQGFTINPTSCAEKAATGVITGTGGASANVSDRFQVGECAALGFKPRMTLRLRGGTKRGKHPALTAILKPRPGDANISEISVAFPRSEFLENAHIRTVCTRPDFAADNCPKGAIYGEATVFTPLLDEPLTGHVYLRSSDNLLPDLVPDLRGTDRLPIRIESAGRTDSIRGGIRNTFDFVPDAPFTKLVLRMQGGRKGLLVNSRDICERAYRATVNFGAHNGRTYTATPALNARCGARGKKGKRLARASAVR